MRVLPILFNTEMVKAILDGRKTVTRRNPFKFEMKDGQNPDWSGYSLGEYFTGHIETGVCLYSRGAHDVWGVRSNVVKPKYNVGDILYVRETWHKYKKRVGEGEQCHIAEFYGYKASIANSEDAEEKWKPSIHMPKEAARIWLKVIDVRVERLQDITEEQAKAEGIREYTKDGKLFKYYSSIDAWEEVHKRVAPKGLAQSWWQGMPSNAIIAFSYLWNPTIKKQDLERYGWDANPYVWVIEFERCEKPQEVEHEGD